MAQGTELLHLSWFKKRNCEEQKYVLYQQL